MSTTTLIEQHPPFILMLASRVPTYAHVLISLLAVILFTAVPSLAIKKPVARAITRKPRSASVASTTSTLVETETDENAVKATPNKVGKEVTELHRTASFSEKHPFHSLGSSIKMMISRTHGKSVIEPSLTRCISMPARRMSSHIVSAIHNITPHLHHHHHEEAGSYFPEQPADVVEVANSVAEAVVVGPNTTKAEASQASVVADEVGREKEAVENKIRQRNDELKAHNDGGLSSLKEPKAFERIARRASMALGFPRRS